VTQSIRGPEGPRTVATWRQSPTSDPEGPCAGREAQPTPKRWQASHRGPPRRRSDETTGYPMWTKSLDRFPERRAEARALPNLTGARFRGATPSSEPEGASQYQKSLSGAEVHDAVVRPATRLPGARSGPASPTFMGFVTSKSAPRSVPRSATGSPGACPTQVQEHLVLNRCHFPTESSEQAARPARVTRLAPRAPMGASLGVHLAFRAWRETGIFWMNASSPVAWP
jgi:hypothetical protein